MTQLTSVHVLTSLHVLTLSSERQLGLVRENNLEWLGESSPLL